MNIIIEITRECNLRCDHCLRGEPEGKSIQRKDVVPLFKALSEQEIYSITFTGGEPALHPEKILMILKLAKMYQVDFMNFYIATNGTIASDNFIRTLMELYLYCTDNESSCVEISNDVFHNNNLIQQNIKKFKILSFTKFKYMPKDIIFNDLFYDSETINKFPDYQYDYNDYNYDHILKQGRGISWGKKEPFVYEVYEKEDFNPYTIDDIELYLNCNGNIILGCDWSYGTQEDHKLCHVTEIHKFLNAEEEI